MTKKPKVQRGQVFEAAIAFAASKFMRINEEYLTQYLRWKVANLPAERQEVSLDTVEQWVWDSQIKLFEEELV